MRHDRFKKSNTTKKGGPSPQSAGASPSRKPTTARQLVFAVFDEYKHRSEFVTHLLEKRLTNSQLSPLDRRLATEITYGLVRRQATLDALIQPHVNRPRENVEPELWTLLQLGTYQLVFLSSIPAHAAVHETVELTRWLGKSRWSGFLNGVLRSISRAVTDEFTTELATDAVPLTDGRYRHLEQDVFPNSTADAAGYFTAAFSFPGWLVERWQKRFSFEELVRLGFWFNTPAGITLRVNTLKTTRADLLAAFVGANIAAHPGEDEVSIRLEESVLIERLPGFGAGWFVVQDESAMTAARLLAPQPGETVLDLCAAPGTKTTHLAELMQNQGTIIATDIHSDRLELVDGSCQRLGIDIIETRAIQQDGHDIPEGPFDAILIDAPCSNTGVLGKRPDVRWRIRPHDLEELPAIQRQLLTAAIARLKPNGRIVYSTCSMEPEENRQVMQAILAEHPSFTIVEEIEHIPGQPVDGGYQVLLNGKP